jgi:hypothetical protein
MDWLWHTHSVVLGSLSGTFEIGLTIGFGLTRSCFLRTVLAFEGRLCKISENFTAPKTETVVTNLNNSMLVAMG